MWVLADVLADHVAAGEAGFGGDCDLDVYGGLEQLYGSVDLREYSGEDADELCDGSVCFGPRDGSGVDDGVCDDVDDSGAVVVLLCAEVFY